MSFNGVQDRGRQFLDLGGKRRTKWWQSLSSATVFATGIFAKGFLNLMIKDVEVTNLDILREAQERSIVERRGLVTIMNHMSLLDDPFVWGILPMHNFTSPGRVRWSLGADNVLFYNDFLASFFSLGQVLSTKRFGEGPFQGSIDASIALLSGYDTKQKQDPRTNLPQTYWIKKDFKGADQQEPFNANWVHIFPEGFVHQVYPPHRYTLRYFHWGASRLMLEATKPPIIVPIYAYGFDNVIPEDKKDDYSLWKQRNKETLRVHVGQPLDDAEVSKYRQQWVDLVKQYEEKEKKVVEGSVSETQVSITSGDMPEELRTGAAAQQLRSEVALYLRSELEKVRVSGVGFEKERLDFGNPEFWNMETGGCVDVPVMGDVNKLEVHKMKDFFHLLEDEVTPGRKRK